MNPRERILALRLIERQNDQRGLIGRLATELRIKEAQPSDGQQSKKEKGGNPHADKA